MFRIIVTPCVGVWIETLGYNLRYWQWKVTPCVGVWIETLPSIFLGLNLESHPAWVCGLKHAYYKYLKVNSMSHPAWVCGLKLTKWLLSSVLRVTPCVGVWIETYELRNALDYGTVTPCVGVWIETEKVSEVLRYCHDVTPCVGVWIETFKYAFGNNGKSHTLRGCVDWNHLSVQSIHSSRGHTLRGCVDWNRKLFLKFIKSLESHPAWVCGLKLGEPPAIIIILQSHPAWVCGLKHPYYNRE